MNNIVITSVPDPRQRRFLRQSVGERLAGIMWMLVWHSLFRCSPGFLHAWRALLLRMFGAQIGRDVRISASTKIEFPWHLRLGDHVIIGEHAIINCMGAVTIGDDTRLSQYAHICAGTHAHTDPNMPIVRSPIHIGERVWIAADAFIGPGVMIGDDVVLAARSSAFSELPAGFVCVGEPATPRKKRDSDVTGSTSLDDEAPSRALSA